MSTRNHKLNVWPWWGSGKFSTGTSNNSVYLGIAPFDIALHGWGVTIADAGTGTAAMTFSLLGSGLPPGAWGQELLYDLDGSPGTVYEGTGDSRFITRGMRFRIDITFDAGSASAPGNFFVYVNAIR